MYNICIMVYSIIQKNYIYMLHDFSYDRKVFFIANCGFFFYFLINLSLKKLILSILTY